jgi:hypothetical protein
MPCAGWAARAGPYLKIRGDDSLLRHGVLFFSFVFLNIPRIDFFLCSVLFLLAFITMFYLR